MVIKELLYTACKCLNENSISNARLDATVLLCHVLNCDRTNLIINENKEVSEADKNEYMKLIKKREKDIPIAYITNNREFMSLDFYVDENVLIPRPDTETLVMHVINSDVSKNKVLDLCCGSGCIGVSIGYYCDVYSVCFADVSQFALETSKKNANNILKNKCETNFYLTDILNDTINGKYDVIVSNPPYIETDVIKTLDKTVADYEPYIALDGGADGLDFYRKISYTVKNNLNYNGMLAFEVGFNQSQDVCKILCENGYENITTDYDLGGICRVVSGRYCGNGELI